MFNKKSILITGATGYFGENCLEKILLGSSPEKVVVYSRDELKQYQLSQKFNENDFPVRYFLGDIRDRDRLIRACANIDIIIHAAAMKQVPAAEYNPTECIATNINGAQNLIDASIINEVEKVIALSTDKAANPINLYGATKLCSDKLFVAANNLVGKRKTRFSIVRYGNVLGSRGSVIPYFKKLIDKGVKKLPLTDEKMTRFVISIENGINFVFNSLKTMNGGEIFVPKLPSIEIKKLIFAMTNTEDYKLIGIRPGEKLHEVMIPKEESLNCVEMKDRYIIQPMLSWWDKSKSIKKNQINGKKIKKPFEYSSENNTNFLSVKDIKNLIKNF
ncbi:UDP-N-acetylglucosamine 4,6-dehydratase (inverting) [Alphaproteobacteria bacterium]|nr:UDP-N-acetylglucosamine 4,6-dehydratase (inverting) [Alphaproteobacteria bacterium]